MNCKIHPILYNYYLCLKKTLGAEIVHRRKRTSSTSIEVIFHCDELVVPTGRLNTLPEAERWGYWIICRLQTKKGKTVYKDHPVYQLYLSPVHPKKKYAIRSHLSSRRTQLSEPMIA